MCSECPHQLLKWVCFANISVHLLSYTALTEQYLPAVMSRLQDPSPLVRRQTLTLITKCGRARFIGRTMYFLISTSHLRLLSEDYLKMKPLLLFSLMSTIVDADSAVRALGSWPL